MPRIELTLITAKLEFMNRYIDQLEKYELISLQSYLDSIDTQLIVERCMQVIAEVGIDINRHILKSLNQSQPETNRNKPIAIAQLNIINSELAQRLNESIGLRNVITHLYDEINSIIVHNAIRKTLKDYSIYQQSIKTFLDSLEQDND